MAGRVSKKEADAWIHANYPRLARMAAFYAKPGTDPDDLLQDVMERKVYPRLRKLLSDGDPYGYIAKAMRTGTVDAWRARNRHREVPMSDAQDVLPPEKSVEEQVVGADAMARLEAAVRALPERQRTVVILKRFRNMTWPQVAAATGFSEGTCKSDFETARRALQRVYDGVSWEVPHE